MLQAKYMPPEQRLIVIGVLHVNRDEKVHFVHVFMFCTKENALWALFIHFYVMKKTYAGINTAYNSFMHAIVVRKCESFGIFDSPVSRSPNVFWTPVAHNVHRSSFRSIITSFRQKDSHV